LGFNVVAGGWLLFCMFRCLFVSWVLVPVCSVLCLRGGRFVFIVCLWWCVLCLSRGALLQFCRLRCFCSTVVVTCLVTVVLFCVLS